MISPARLSKRRAPRPVPEVRNQASGGAAHLEAREAQANAADGRIPDVVAGRRPVRTHVIRNHSDG